MKEILEQAQEQAERDQKIVEMQREQERELDELRIRHGVERLLGRRVNGHWCMQSYPYLNFTDERPVYVVEGLRFTRLGFNSDKPVLRVWGEWDGEEGRPWWSDELRTISDLAKVQFDPPAEEENGDAA